MNQKRIFLSVSFFLVASFIFGWVIFNKDNFFPNKIEGEVSNLSAKKENSDVLEKKNELNCEDSWEKYANDVLGIGFCYPKEWGYPFIDPVENLTLLDGAVEEYSQDEHNVFSNSLFIRFKQSIGNEIDKNKSGVELRIFNENYKGEYYPNGAAYDKGYVDNIAQLKSNKNICEYKWNFTELWAEQGKLTEFWNECEKRIKTRIINHEQYFDKNIYSYDLESLAYFNLENGFFDNVLATKKYLHIGQVDKKINKFEDVFEAKNYSSQVDNSAVISQEEYLKQKEEFGKFIESIYSYKPIEEKKDDFKIMDGEDEKNSAMRKYYWLIENQKLEEAYEMHNRINISLDDFKFAHKKVKLAKARDFKNVNDNTYKFFVDYQRHNKPKTLYRITMRSTDANKIEIISEEEIVSDIVRFKDYSSYAKKQNGKIFLVLERYGAEMIVDEGVADYNSDQSNINEVKFFEDIKFSKNGNYLIYKMRGWEWMASYIYDIGEAKQVFESDSPHTFSFDKDEKNLFVCSSAGMSTSASGTIYGLPDFNKQFELFKLEKSTTLEVSCDYDENKNELIFIYDKDCFIEEEEKNDKCKKYEVIYSFGENKMINSRVIE